MFCPKCGAQNPDGVSFCEKCGSPLQAGAPQQPPVSYPSGGTMMPNKNPKSAIVAAILNLFFGLGYWYLGYKKVLGIPTFGFVVAMLIVYFIIGFFTIGLVSLIIAIILAIDGYQKAQGQRGFISTE